MLRQKMTDEEKARKQEIAVYMTLNKEKLSLMLAGHTASIRELNTRLQSTLASLSKMPSLNEIEELKASVAEYKKADVRYRDERLIMREDMRSIYYKVIAISQTCVNIANQSSSMNEVMASCFRHVASRLAEAAELAKAK